MTQEETLQFYRTIIDNYYGAILVIDKTGKIIFHNNYQDYVIPPSQLLNRNLSDLVEEGIYAQSPSLKALKSKKTEVEYLKRRGKSSLITTSVPILNEEGDIRFIVAYSQNEKLTYELVSKVENEKNRALQALSYLSNTQNGRVDLVCADPKMNQLVQFVKQVSLSDSNVLLTGESGTGKDVFARFIHANSPRSEHVYIPINCAAIPADLMESEFFGYARGAFTGAKQDGKAGLFELAENGTLFLDEIGELPLSLQSKLLRVLDSGEIKRIGSDKIKKTNVRVLAATNRDLEDMVKNGTFRHDLYYRLNVIPVIIPPLRERKADITVLANTFLNDLNQKYATQKFFSPEATKEMLRYNWPGNAREIKNVVERMYITNQTNMLHLHTQLETKQVQMTREPIGEQHRKNEIQVLPLKETIRQFEEELISNALQSCNGNVAKTAKKLGITRACLYKKLSAIKNSKQIN